MFFRWLMIQLPFQITPHRQDIGDQAQEADGACEARKAARPGGEFRPIGKRQAKELADHQERHA
jgi:hypothetical protein